MRKTGDKVPDFDLPDDRGGRTKARELRGKRWVLFFYPKDDTPTCTREACAFRDEMPRFDEAGVPVFGISADTVVAHQRFVRKFGLNYPLLADDGHRVAEAFGTWVEKQLYGRHYMGIARTTFLVGADGRIEQVWDKVKADTHGAEVLAYLRGEPAPVTGATQAAKPGLKKTAIKKKAVGKKSVTRKGAARKPAARKPTVRKAAARKATARRKPARKS